MKLTSKITFNSKLPGYETVRFTLNKMTEGRKVALTMAHNEPTDKIRSVQAQINDILALAPNAEDGSKEYSKLDQATQAKFWSLISEREIIADSKIKPEWIRIGLKSIENLETEDGVAVTPETFIDEAPSELFNEVLEAIQAEAGLSPAERKN